MAQKKITDLQLIGSVVDALSIPSDNSIQSYRFTALQMYNYIVAKFGTGVSVQQMLKYVAGVPTWKYPLSDQTAAQTSTYAISATADQVVLLNPTGGGFTATLPTAASVAGKVYYLKNVGTNFLVATIATTSSQTIDGVVGTTLNSPGECLWLVSDGSNWIILKRHIPSPWTTTTTTVTGSGGNPTKGAITKDILRYRRMGQHLEMEIMYIQTTSGAAAGTGNYLYTIPASLVIDTTLAETGSGPTSDGNQYDWFVGYGWIQRNGGAGANAHFRVSDSTHLYVNWGHLADTTGTVYSAESGNTFAAGSAVNYGHNMSIFAKLTVPISGWKCS